MDWLKVARQPPLRLVQLDTGRRNVLGREAIEALKDALSPDAEAPVVVLSGRSDGFCSGLDNKILAAGRAERESLLAAMGELLGSALTGATRIVAVCEGHAVAAGAMLLLVADIRIGSPGTYKVGFTEPGLGMPLPELPALLARQRLDRRRLHAVTVLGRTLSPVAAVDAGFLDEIAEGQALRETALERAREIAALTDAAYLGSLRSVWGAALDRVAALVEDQARRADAARDA